jgi:hypothetical protein
VTYLKPELRYVLDLVGDEADHDSRAETIRELVLEALVHRGYPETIIRQHFLRFSLSCEESGKVNPYAARP